MASTFQLQRSEFFLGRLLGLPYQPKRSTSQKLAEKAKNVLAIKILYQNLKKSTFQLQHPEFFYGRLLGRPYQPKRHFFFAYRVVTAEELFAQFFVIYKKFGHKNPTILTLLDSFNIASQAECLVIYKCVLKIIWRVQQIQPNHCQEPQLNQAPPPN